MNQSSCNPQSDAMTREVEIINRQGLHARAAMQFADKAAEFDSQILVQKGDLQVDGKSLMDLMSLAAEKGARLILSALGPDATASLDALADLILRKFDEED
jgi:phosphotransferase system HPr (HPr) family protein